MIKPILAGSSLVALLAASVGTSALAVPFEEVKTARSNASTVQTESNSATDREFSPINATDMDERFSDNLLLSQARKRCEFVGAFASSNPDVKICTYRCRGFGALATFPVRRNKPCPPSFDGLFPGP